MEYSIIIKTAKDHLRPEFPRMPIPPQLEKLIRRCWSAFPEKRPLCDKIVNKLKKLETLYQHDPQLWDSVRDTSKVVPLRSIADVMEVNSADAAKRGQLTQRDLEDLESFFHLQDDTINIEDHIERGRSLSFPEEQLQTGIKAGKKASSEVVQSKSDMTEPAQPSGVKKGLNKDEKARVLIKMSSMPIGLIMPKKPPMGKRRPKSGGEHEDWADMARNRNRTEGSGIREKPPAGDGTPEEGDERKDEGSEKREAEPSPRAGRSPRPRKEERTTSPAQEEKAPHECPSIEVDEPLPVINPWPLHPNTTTEERQDSSHGEDQEEEPSSPHAAPVMLEWGETEESREQKRREAELEKEHTRMLEELQENCKGAEGGGDNKEGKDAWWW